MAGGKAMTPKHPKHLGKETAGTLVVPERAARLIHEKKMGPAIIVFSDCFTALGGNQYVNSSAIGDYADYSTTTTPTSTTGWMSACRFCTRR